jgi:Protein of unknown function (DUF4065)
MNTGFSNNVNSLPEGAENQVLLVARMVREHYFPGRDKNFPDWLLVLALIDLLRQFPTASLDDLFETMKLPANIESAELRRRIHTAIADCRKHVGKNLLNTCIFSGGKPFTFEKVGAMSAYLCYREEQLSNEQLDRLLFYSDFAHYRLYGESISGARYIRQWDGPGQEFFERNLDSMLSAQILRKAATCGESVCASSERITDELSIAEIATLNWTHSTFGSMSSPELDEQLRHETCHKFTRRGDYVAYEYSKLFKQLPAKPAGLKIRPTNPC